MSTPITAKYFDGRLNDIRAVAHGMTDEVPFLLLPLRIETRFMKVEKPDSELGSGQLERILGQLGLIATEFVGGIPNLNTTKLRKKYTQVRNDLSQVVEQIGDLPALTRRQKSWVQDLGQTISREGMPVISELRTRSSLRTIANQLSDRINELDSAIARIVVRPNYFYDASSSLIDDLNALNKSLGHINAGKIPYTKPANKRRLYQFIEKTYDDVAHFYRIQEDKFETVKVMHSAQLTRIKALHRNIAEEIKQLPNSIRSIHRDTNWRNFVANKAEEADTRLPALFGHFENQDLKKFEFATTIKKTEAGELYFKGIKTLVDLHKFNKSDFSKYHQVKTSRAKIKNKILGLQKTAGQAIDAQPGQIAAFQSLWTNINDAFEGYKSKINQIEGLNNSQQFGIDQSIIFINDNAQQALGPITSNPVQNFSFVNNQQINNSWAFVSNSVSSLHQLNQNFGTQEGHDAVQLLSHIQGLNQQFAIAARDHTVLNNQDLQQLQGQVSQLQENISTFPPTERNAIQLELERMGVHIANYHILDNVNFLDPDWTGPIFITPTTTVNELWVRIFPDDIFVDTHEEELSKEEIEDGKDFWLSYWAAGTDYDLQLGAWRYLHESYGPQRADWIAKRMDPRATNRNRFDSNNQGRTPSLRLIQGTERLTLINAAIKSALAQNGGDPTLSSIISSLQAANTNALFETAYRKIRSLKSDQAYFLQKMWDQMRIAGTYLEQINTMGRLSSLSSGQQAFWRENLELFTEISKELREIQPWTTAQMINKYRSRLNFTQVENALGDPKAEQWTKAPQAKGLPDRFVVLTMNGNKFTHIITTNAVDQDLKLGLDPQNFDRSDEELDQLLQLDEDENLIITDDIKWMMDYEEAVRKGMAVTIPLSQEEAEAGFDKLLVLGIKHGQNGQDVLADLFQNHRYAHDGMGFLQIGAPTNNTKKQPSDFKNLESDVELSFKLALGLPLYEPTSTSSSASFEDQENALLNKPDGQRLAEALGLEADFFQHIQGSERTQIGNSIAINKSMWHATFGFYMEEMWDTMFTYDNIDRTRHFFNHYCLGRGLLPSLRIGTQPYGILPTTAFSRMKFRIGNSGNETIDSSNIPTVTRSQMLGPMTTNLNNRLQVRYDARLAVLLQDLNKIWTYRRNQNVKHNHNVQNGDNPQQHFMNMLGLHATSVEHYFRFGINIASKVWLDHTFLNFEEHVPYGPQKLAGQFGKQLLDGRYYGALDFVDETPGNSLIRLLQKLGRIQNQFKEAGLFKWRFFDHDSRFSSNMITTRPFSETEGLENLPNTNENYIEWLLSHNLFHILGSTAPGQVRSNQALFLMLRQSLLMAYRSAAMGILELEDFFEEPYRKFIGSANNYKIFLGNASEFNYATKWTYLFREFGTLDQTDFQNYSGKNFYQYFNSRSALTRAMAEYLYPLEGNSLIENYSQRDNHEPFFKQIKEVRTAFAKLATLPTKELDRLFHEHLDLNTYRLDAWMLGLANRKLITQRTARPEKLYLGAYGWLEDLRRGDARDLAESVPAGLYKPGERDIYTDKDNDEGFIHAPSLDHALTAAILRSGYKSNSTVEDIGNQMAVNLSSRRVRRALNLVQGVQNGLDIGAILGFQFERGLHERYQTDSDLELDRYILPLRQAYPLQVQIEETAANTEEKLHNNVINGKTLLDEIQTIIKTNDLPPEWSAYDVLTRSDFFRCPTKVVKAVSGYNTVSALRAGESGSAENRLIKHLRAVCQEIDKIADAFDALGDLAISESVYQVVQGNYARVGSLLQALAEGKAPAEFQIVNTPRTGTVINQRVVLNIDRTVSARPDHWNASLTPRAQAEPSVNKWLGEILGDPADIRCLATYKVGETDIETSVSLENLAIHPVDVLHLLGENPEKGGSELGRRVAYNIKAEEGLMADAEIQLRFTERDPAWASESGDIKSFYEIEPLVKKLRDLLTDSRALSSEDLKNPEQVPDMDNPGDQNLSELANRVNPVLQAIRVPTDNLSAWFGAVDSESASFTDAQLAEIEVFLHLVAAYGIPNGIPDNMQGLANNAMQTLHNHTQSILQLAKNKVATPGNPADLPRPIIVLDEGVQALENTEWWPLVDAGNPAYSDDQIVAIAAFMELAEEFGIAGAGLPNNGYVKGMITAIYTQVKGALAKAKERLGPIAALEAKANDTEQPIIRRVEALVEISKQLFGKSFLILPNYRPGDLKTAIKNQHDLPADQQLIRNVINPVPLIMEDWLHCIADVRPKMYALQMSGVLGEAFGLDPLAMLPAQMPYQSGDYWVGRPYPEDFKLQEDKLSLVLVNPEKLTSGSPNSYEVGIVLDEWVEIIPNTHETTGITFNYDQPNAKPPQNLLLAVTPEQTRHWNWDDLVFTLLETLELAKNRAVEPEHLEQSELAQALPAIVAEASLSQNVPPNFTLLQVLNNFQWILFQPEQ